MSRISRARWRNVSSPSLSEIELTMPRPRRCFMPSVIASQLLESIMTGTVDVTLSEASASRKRAISRGASSMASSTFTSITAAPALTCARAMSMASSIWFSFISRRNLRLPATLQRSPILTKSCPVGGMSVSCNPARSIWPSACGISRVDACEASAARARMWSGVVPQQPPTMLSSRASSSGFIAAAMVSGVSS